MKGMGTMKFQKGQSIVEFAIILPFLIIFMIGLMYFGFMFSNYVALNDIARDAARGAAMVSDEDFNNYGYNGIRQNYLKRYADSKSEVPLNEFYLPNTTYRWDPSNEEQFSIEYTEATSTLPNGEVVVTLKAVINRDQGGLFGTFSGVLGSSVMSELPVTYHMYSEVKHTPSDDD